MTGFYHYKGSEALIWMLNPNEYSENLGGVVHVA